MTEDARTVINRAAAVAAVRLTLAPLVDLQAWEPVGEPFERLAGVLHGGEGLRADEVRRLAAWAARWRRLARPVRVFYRAEVEEAAGGPLGAVEAGLWFLLRGGAAPEAAQRFAIRSRWEERYGTPPRLDLLPYLI